MYRDEVTHEPHEYYAKLPADAEQRTCLVVDPMLATGGSATAAIDYLRGQGVKDVRLLVLVAAPEGIKTVLDHDPDVRLYTCSIDEALTTRHTSFPVSAMPETASSALCRVSRVPLGHVSVR